MSGQNDRLVLQKGEKENRMLTGDIVRTAVVADTSLYIPGFGGQGPVSVDVVGVDSNGRTTWRIQPGQQTGTIPPAPIPLTGKFVTPKSSLVPTKDVRPHHGLVGGLLGAFPAYIITKGWITDFNSRFLSHIATMVQGPSDAVVYASIPELEISISCAINSGVADCVGDVDQGGATVTTSIHETVKPLLVEGGGSGGGSSPPAPTPAPSGSGSPSNHGSAVATAMIGVGVLFGSVVAGMATLFLV